MLKPYLFSCFVEYLKVHSFYILSTQINLYSRLQSSVELIACYLFDKHLLLGANMCAHDMDGMCCIISNRASKLYVGHIQATYYMATPILVSTSSPSSFLRSLQWVFSYTRMHIMSAYQPWYRHCLKSGSQHVAIQLELSTNLAQNWLTVKKMKMKQCECDCKFQMRMRMRIHVQMRMFMGTSKHCRLSLITRELIRLIHRTSIPSSMSMSG